MSILDVHVCTLNEAEEKGDRDIGMAGPSNLAEKPQTPGSHLS